MWGKRSQATLSPFSCVYFPWTFEGGLSHVTEHEGKCNNRRGKFNDMLLLNFNVGRQFSHQLATSRNIRAWTALPQSAVLDDSHHSKTVPAG